MTRTQDEQRLGSDGKYIVSRLIGSRRGWLLYRGRLRLTAESVLQALHPGYLEMSPAQRQTLDTSVAVEIVYRYVGTKIKYVVAKDNYHKIVIGG